MPYTFFASRMHASICSEGKNPLWPCSDWTQQRMTSSTVFAPGAPPRKDAIREAISESVICCRLNCAHDSTHVTIVASGSAKSMFMGISSANAGVCPIALAEGSMAIRRRSNSRIRLTLPSDLPKILEKMPRGPTSFTYVTQSLAGNITLFR